MDQISIIAISIVIIAIALSVFVLIKGKTKKLRHSDLLFVQSEWQKINDELRRNPQHSILNADKLLGHVLKLKGIEGSVGEQLKKSSKLFSNIDDVWYAHKTRNRIAHELNLNLSDKEIKRVLSIFKQSLQNLGIKI